MRLAGIKWHEMLPSVILVLTGIEGIIDSTTPRGISDWMFFMVPILLTGWLPKRWTLWITGAATVLTIVGFFLPVQPIDNNRRFIFAIINRVIGISVFWITALLINLHRKALANLEQAHKDVGERTQKLLEGERLKTEFLADTSHELRAPLAIIKSYLDLALGKKSKAHTDPYKALRGINAEVKHISQVITDLMLLMQPVSRPDRTLITNDVTLKDLVTEVIKKFRPLAKSKKIIITDDLAVITCRGDKEKLEKLFSNLFGNAIQYGKEHGHIHVTAQKDLNYATIEVRDDGIGISEKDMPFIFERFYRVEKARTRTNGGVGLGLAICKWITEAHGGRIEASSVLGNGSTFTVKLPCIQV